MLSKIHPVFFILAFAAGLFACYITHPKPEIVVKFPSPYNVGSVTYKDEENNSCYKYRADKHECPRDSSMIKEQPMF